MTPEELANKYPLNVLLAAKKILEMRTNEIRRDQTTVR